MGGQLRPRNITQDAFAAKLREAGFPACSKAAVSLAERSKESGVEFTAEARKAAQKLFNQPRRAENRKDGNKTTVWLDDDLREWVESRAYMEEISVGAFIRVVLREHKFLYEVKKANERTFRRLVLPFIKRQKEAASDAGTSEAAQREEKTAFPLPSKNNTNQEENQV